MKFRVGKTLPIKNASVPTDDVERGARLSFIGRIQDSSDGDSGDFALQGMDGNYYYRLKSRSMNLDKYTGKDLWISGILKDRGNGGSPPVLEVKAVTEPKSPTWRYENNRISRGSRSGQKTMQDEMDAENPEFVDEGFKTATTSSNPPKLTIDEIDVGGAEGEIDRITTPDEGEWFWNFDQELAETYEARDHAVCMFFYNNAEIDKVKDDIFWGQVYFHSTMYMRHYEPDCKSAPIYDWDKGSREKTLPGKARHIRVYAPPGIYDRFYSEDLGKFVVGTVHWDDSSNNEEDTEDSLCQRAQDKGYTVYEDYCFISTEEGANNGYVSYVDVP